MQRKHLITLFLILFFCTVPWLGVCDFHTKPEPREAIVSMTMLEQNNWILPHNNGGEIAYKPPFFHWTVALTALATGGMSEWASRFPSALATIILLVWMYCFYAKRRDSKTALFASVICFSTFEIMWASYSCRVDMVLTLGIVGAMFAFADWIEKGRHNIPWLAILMMSMGCLTKGPVAIVLPCGVGGLYMLIRKDGFWKAFAWMAFSAMASLILPAVWYYFAYQQGGDEFLFLVTEENLNRFIGKMAYRSHEFGIWYYFAVLPAGLLPWFLPAAYELWKKREIQWPIQKPQIRKETLFSIIAFLVVFVFYCIPKSKRDAYIIPVYPFAAWFIAITLNHWSDKLKIKVTATILAIFMVMFIIIHPLEANPRSDRDIAQDIENMHLQKPIYGHFEEQVPGNPFHPFTVNYYLHDGIDGNWNGQTSGYLLVGEKDGEAFKRKHPEFKYTLIYTSNHKSGELKQIVKIYQFVKK